MSTPTEVLKNRFGFHPAVTEEAKNLHADIRACFFNLGVLLNENLPAGREAAVVQTKLEEAMFWANAAVARALSDLED